jgi:cyclase
MNQNEAGGTLTGLVEAVERLLEIIPPSAKIIPGHYKLSDTEGLRRTHTMLVETISHVRKVKAVGHSLEEIQKQGLPKTYEQWGKTGYTDADGWIANIFQALEMGQ